MESKTSDQESNIKYLDKTSDLVEKQGQESDTKKPFENKGQESESKKTNLFEKRGQENLSDIKEPLDQTKEEPIDPIPDIQYLKCFCWIGFHLEAKRQENTTAKIACFKCREIMADTEKYFDHCQEMNFGMIFCSKCYKRDDPLFEAFNQKKDDEDEYETDDEGEN